MEVLEHGNSYKQIKCPHCDALLGYTEEDIKDDIKVLPKLGRRDTWMRATGIKQYIQCPECLSSISIREI